MHRMSSSVHPRYSAHFVDPLYESRHLDAAPFGSDQGADMLRDVEEAGGVLPDGASISTLLPWGDVQGCFAAAATGDVDGLSFIYAAGFLLIRYVGRLDRSDYETLRKALQGLAEELELDQITVTVLPDLEEFMRAQP